MYAVVHYVDGKETSAGEVKPWNEAYAEYEKDAAFTNETDSDGKYKRPRLRVAIRKIN